MAPWNSRRIQGLPVLVKQICKIMDKKCKFPEGGSVSPSDHCLCSKTKFFSAAYIMESRPCLLDDQCSKHPVKLMGICK